MDTWYTRTRRWSQAPYADLLAAWERFAEEMCDYGQREVPDLMRHPDLARWSSGGGASG